MLNVVNLYYRYVGIPSSLNCLLSVYSTVQCWNCINTELNFRRQWVNINHGEQLNTLDFMLHEGFLKAFSWENHIKSWYINYDLSQKK